MAEKPVLDREINVSSESVRIPFTFDEIQSRFLAVDIEIEARADSVGTAVFDRYVPRIWSGYWYLVNNNSIKKYGAIEFKRQRIYEKEFPNLAYGMNNAFFDAGAVFGLELELDDLKAWYAASDFLANEDNEANGLYLAHPVSELIIYIPVGVDLSIKIARQAYPDVVDVDPSSNPVTGLDGELVSPNPVKPLESVNSDILGGVDRPPTLDDYVRDKGYILAQECSLGNAEQINNILDNSLVDPDLLLNNLLQNGSISQSDIDEILAANPSFSSLDVVKALVNSGEITPQEFYAVYESTLLRSTIPNAGKKASYFLILSACNVGAITYSLRNYNINANGTVSARSVGFTGSGSGAIPSPSNVDWGAVVNSPPFGGFSASLQSLQTNTDCGVFRALYNILNGETPIGTAVSLTSPAPKFVFWVQP